MDTQNSNSPEYTSETASPEPLTLTRHVSTQSQQLHHEHSMLGVYSLLSGLCIATIAVALPNLPFIVHASSNTVFYISYGVLAAACLLSFLGVSIPSFKKTSYPNISGLTGLILNLFVLYTTISVIVVLIATGNN
jgi:hypothetical protein